MAAEHHPDLSAFPLLRLDELQLIDLHTLEQSQRDLRALIAQEDASEAAGGLGSYLQRQQQAVAGEIIKKRASLRVQALLFDDEGARQQLQDSLLTGAKPEVVAPIEVPVAPACKPKQPSWTTTKNSMPSLPPRGVRTSPAPATTAAPGESRVTCDQDHCDTPTADQDEGFADGEEEAQGSTLNWQDGGGGRGPLHFVVRPPRPKRRTSVVKESNEDPETERASILSKDREARRVAAQARLERRRQQREAQKQRHRQRHMTIGNTNLPVGSGVRSARGLRDAALHRGHSQSSQEDGVGAGYASSESECVSGGDSSEADDLPQGGSEDEEEEEVGGCLQATEETDIGEETLEGGHEGSRLALKERAEEKEVDRSRDSPRVEGKHGMKREAEAEGKEGGRGEEEEGSAMSSAGVRALSHPEEEGGAKGEGKAAEEEGEVGEAEALLCLAATSTQVKAGEGGPASSDSREEESPRHEAKVCGEDPSSPLPCSNDASLNSAPPSPAPLASPAPLSPAADAKFSSSSSSSSDDDGLEPVIPCLRAPASPRPPLPPPCPPLPCSPPPCTHAPPPPAPAPVVDYTSVFPHLGFLVSCFYDKPHYLHMAAQGPASRKALLPWSATVEKALEGQVRLYGLFRRVMGDYAAVFSRPSPSYRPLSLPSSQGSNALIYGGTPVTLHYRVVASSRPEVYNIVLDVLRTLPQWEELPNDLGLKTTWNLLWTWSRPRINYASLLFFQRVNHFPNSRELTRKDLLKRHLGRYVTMASNATRSDDPLATAAANNNTAATSKGAQEWGIMPQTFILPQEYTDFLAAHTAAVSNEGSPCIWIIKPVGLSRGRGIRLVDDIYKLTYSEMVIAQRYVKRPLLLDGYKWDLRLYVLVTSFQPLEAFIYKEGFARISTERYGLHDLQNRLVHLTNSSIQKLSHTGPSDDSPLKTATSNLDAGGTKVSLTYLWRRLSSIGVDVSAVWASITSLVLKSLLCVEDLIPYQPNAFEVFGYDVLIDEDHRPWLLEVNASPSMARENKLDETVKERMIRDTILLVDPLPFDRDALFQVLQRRLTKTTQGAAPSSVQDDLHSVLRGRMPRLYGEMPAHLGSYERIAPATDAHTQVMKLKRRYVRGSASGPFSTSATRTSTGTTKTAAAAARPPLGHKR